MPTKAAAPRAKSKRSAAAKTPSLPAIPSLPTGLPMLRLAQELRRWTDGVLGIAGSAAELSLNLAKARAQKPDQREALERASSLLRQSREAAGMTTQELGQAIDMDDPALLEQAEKGKVALPFEIILRLAGVLGRHDPSTFALQLARSSNPQLWQMLDELGIGRMVAQAGREREMANIYRANDAARRLSDAEFAQVLGFVKAGFDMAVQFRMSGAAAKTRAK